MRLINSKIFNKIIIENFDYDFDINERGLYVISISASCRSGKQTNERGGEDLRIEIDGQSFREIPPEKNIQLYNIPASWNGTKLKSLKKTVVFILFLEKGSHKITFIPYKGAKIEDIKIEFIENTSKREFNLEGQAEDGDRRPWYTFALINLPLKSLSAKATTKWRFWDSDDVKLIINGKIQKPEGFFSKWGNWLWAGSIFKKLSQNETQTKTIELNLSQGIHYIEFYADRRPTLHNVELDFGEEIKVKRVPTVDDPEWTGNFDDDTEQMLLARLLLGEAEDQSKETKIWIAGSVLNRVKANAWGNTLHEVIQRYKQYDPFKTTDLNFSKVINPLKDADDGRKKAWFESYEVAKKILSGEIKNPTEATHFHGRGIEKEWFIDRIVPNGKFLRKIDDTYFYWSPN